METPLNYPPSGDDENAAEARQKTGHHVDHRKKWHFASLALPVMGLASLLWFLIRVIPKPSRANYPCQRAAFPIASGFVVWLTSMVVSSMAFCKAKQLKVRGRYAAAGLFAAVAVMLGDQQ